MSHDRPGRLAGRIAVVTGAAGGIGSAIAQAYADEGAVVGLLDLDPGATEELARQLGRGAFALVCDVTDEARVSEAFTRVRALHGRLDILFTAAAVQLNGRDAPADALEADVWRHTVDVNLTGTFLACKHALRLMLDEGRGSIVICGSPTGMRGVAPGFDAYSASKGGVMAFARVLAMDYVRAGIRVNTLVPGTTETPLILANIADPAALEAVESAIPLGRLAKPAEYASLAVYLASDESAYATGAEFVIDGGITAR